MAATVVQISRVSVHLGARNKPVHRMDRTGLLASRRSLRPLHDVRDVHMSLTVNGWTASLPTSESDDQRPPVTNTINHLLQVIANTESGNNISEEKRKTANSLLDALAAIGQGSRPLQNDLIFGNYDVAFVSPGNSQDGQPAGGRFRTGLGRALFRTTRLCQSVLRPDIVVNKIEILLFGFLPCAVGLRGRLTSIPETPGGTNNQDTVKVFFDPPVLSLPGGIHTTFGPPSSVVLKTTYLDERVRLGLGSRGSRFVFTRGGESDAAAMEQVGLQQTSLIGKVLIFGLVAGMIVGGGFLVQRLQAPTTLRAMGAFSMLLGAALGGVLYRGGILNGDPASKERPEVQSA